MQTAQDPIVAVATPAGRGAVGIVRVSGAALAPLVLALCGKELPARQACYLPFLDGHAQAIDQGLALYFPAPHSFTGEDVLELQAHGGPVVLQLLVQRCVEAAQALAQQTPATATSQALGRIRLAQPGEFTQRAFLNGKLDLTQAEAVADLIEATTEQAARSATRSLTGAFSEEVARLKAGLTDLRVWVEASIDFPEEEIDFLAHTKLINSTQQLREQVQTVLSKTRQGALMREGLTVVIAGQPNAGKSSLLNALAGAEIAIVTPVAGTTRDKISQTIQIEGIALHVVDTAGLRESEDPVETIGIAKAWTEIAKADAVIFLHDVTRWQHADATASAAYRAADRAIAARVSTLVTPNVPTVHVWNKIDAAAWASSPEVVAEFFATTPFVDHAVMSLSAKTGEGLQTLRQTLLNLAGWQNSGDGIYTARARHVQALQHVQEHLDNAAHHLVTLGQLDVAAEELRLAHNALAPITGEMSSDSLLGLIFSSFCIGK